MAKKIKAAAKPEPIDMDRMIECIRAIKERERFKKELESEIDGFKTEIKNVMTAHKLDEMVCDVFTVRYRDVSSDRFDQKAFKERYGTLFDKFVKTVTAKHFTIT